MKMRIAVSAATVFLALGVAAGALFLSGALTSRAVQNPSMSIDMVPAGNTYSDPGLGGNNSITGGGIDSSSTGRSNGTPTHQVPHLLPKRQDPRRREAPAHYNRAQM